MVYDRAESVTIQHSICQMVSGTHQNKYSHAISFPQGEETNDYKVALSDNIHR